MIDEDVVAFAKGQAVRHVAQRERGRANEGNLVRLGIQDSRGEFPSFLDFEQRQQRLLVALCCIGCVMSDCIGHAPRQRTDAGMTQKNLVRRNREFVPPQLFIRVQFRDRHCAFILIASLIC